MFNIDHGKNVIYCAWDYWLVGAWVGTEYVSIKLSIFF